MNILSSLVVCFGNRSHRRPCRISAGKVKEQEAWRDFLEYKKVKTTQGASDKHTKGSAEDE